MRPMARISFSLEKSSTERVLSDAVRSRVYGAVLDRLSEAVAVLDCQGRILEQNEAHAELLANTTPEGEDVTPSGYLGRETFHEMMRVVNRGESFRKRVRCASPTGEPRLLDYSAFALAQEVGAAEYVVTMAAEVAGRMNGDVLAPGLNASATPRNAGAQSGMDGTDARSERVSAPEGVSTAESDVLREAEVVLAALMGAATDIVFVKDPQGRYVHLNTVGCRVLGCSPAQVVGKQDDELWPREIAACYREADRRILESGMAYTVEQSTQIDGRPVTYLTVEAPCRDADGRIVGLVGIARETSERRAVEAALRSSREQLREALQASNTGLWEWNTATNAVSYSREWKLQLGYEEAELPDTFETWECRLHPEDHDRVMAKLRTYLDHPVGDYQHEFRLRHKDGSYRWIVSRASLMPETDGRRVRLLGSHVDITEWKRAESALRESEERYRAIFESMPDPLLIVGFDGIVRDANPAACLCYGYAREEVQGLPVIMLIDGPSHPHLRKALEAVRRGERQHHVACLDVRKDGRRFPAEVHISPFIYNGEPVMLFSVRDITERKRTEAELYESHERLRQALEASLTGTWRVDLRTGLDTRDASLNRMLGLTAESSTQPVDDWFSYAHPDDQPAIRRAWEQAMTTGLYEIEHRLIRRDGMELWVHDRGVVVRGESGSGEYAVGAVTDITDRKRAEFLQLAETRIVEAIARQRPLAEVFALVTRAVEDVVEDVRCSILLLDPDGVHLRLAAAPSLPESYNQAADGIVIGPNAGSCGSAVYRCEPVIVADIEHDPLWDGCRELPLRHGLRACWSTPICSMERKVLGTFALYAQTPRSPSSFELNVVERMTHLTGFAIERLRAEQALRESQANLRRITNAIPGFVYQYRVGPDGSQSFPFASRGTIDLLGCEASELEADANVGWKAVLPEDVDGLRDSIAVSAAGVSPWTHEFRVRSRDGTLRWLRGSSLPERQADGALVWYGLFTDVTARREQERQLRFTQFAMDHAADAIVWAGPDTHIVYANHEACRRLGYTREEFLHLTLSDIAPQHDPGRFEKRLAEIMRGQSEHYVSVYRTKDGREVPVEVSVRYLEQEGAVYTCASARDITERQLLEQRLRHADRLATLGTITAGVAHELNNPLFVITGHLQLIERNLERRQLKAIRKELLAAQDAAVRATEIVNQFLSTAHASAGERERCDVPAIARRAVALLRSDLRSREIAIDTVFPASIPSVEADPQALLHVFLNLLTNARQALQSAGRLGRIQFALETVEVRDEKVVQCRLRDNGPGIRPEHLPRIFDPFFTTKPVGEGTGLGLAICRRLVDELSGTITCQSTPGEGATFVVRLPVARAGQVGRPRGRTLARREE